MLSAAHYKDDIRFAAGDYSYDGEELMEGQQFRLVGKPADFRMHYQGRMMLPDDHHPDAPVVCGECGAGFNWPQMRDTHAELLHERPREVAAATSEEHRKYLDAMLRKDIRDRLESQTEKLHSSIVAAAKAIELSPA